MKGRYLCDCCNVLQDGERHEICPRCHGLYRSILHMRNQLVAARPQLRRHNVAQLVREGFARLWRRDV